MMNYFLDNDDRSWAVGQKPCTIFFYIDGLINVIILSKTMNNRMLSRATKIANSQEVSKQPITSKAFLHCNFNNILSFFIDSDAAKGEKQTLVIA